MSFYVVINPTTRSELWLAWEDLDNSWIYAYVPNLGTFVRHDALAQDFYWDMDLTYRPVEVGEAAGLVEQNMIGKLDARTYQKAVLDRLQAVPEQKAPADLLGPVRTVTQISTRQAAAARADRLRHAAPGEWVTWKKYSPEHRQRAYVAANNLRTGKIRALDGLSIETRIDVEQSGQLVVLVAQQSVMHGDRNSAAAAEAARN